jgi:hypothetical protein
MSATDKLIEELRDTVANCRNPRPKQLAEDFWPALADEIELAADTISSLKEENDRLRAALEPFANEALEDCTSEYRWEAKDDNDIVCSIFADLTFGDFRRAASALSDTGETG